MHGEWRPVIRNHLWEGKRKCEDGSRSLVEDSGSGAKFEHILHFYSLFISIGRQQKIVGKD